MTPDEIDRDERPAYGPLGAVIIGPIILVIIVAIVAVTWWVQ